MIPLLYKVLGGEGEAIHGGSGKWPLPHDGEPGDWMDVEGAIMCCSNGLHLVVDPLPWLRKGARLFLAEPDLSKPSSMDGNKGAFARARLVVEITPDWPLLMMAPHIRCFLLVAGLWPDYKPDLRSADLRYANLSCADLSYADLSSANLSCADLSYADLSSANLSCADLSYADLSSANLRYAIRSTNPPDGWKVNDSGLLVKE